jgi:hypothetical protein
VTDRLFIRDRKRPANPSAAEYLRKEIARLTAEEPQPPPEVVAYRRAHNEWRKEIDRLRGNLRDTTTKRYEVCRDLGWATEIIGSADTRNEAYLIKRQTR